MTQIATQHYVREAEIGSAQPFTHERKVIDMDLPTYEGVLEPWKAELIISRAKLMKFRQHEIADVMQEVAIELLEFHYDQEHAAGATEATVLAAVIDNCLHNIKRSAARYQEHLEQLGNEAVEQYDIVDTRALDVADAISRLSEQEQVVCRGLASGQTITHIAKQLGCSWHTVKRITQRLRVSLHELDPDKGAWK